ATVVPATSTELGKGVHDVRGRYHRRWSAIARSWRRRASCTRSGARRPLHHGPHADGAGRLRRSRFVRPSYGVGVVAGPQGPLGLEIGHGGGGPGFAHGVFAIPARSALAIVLTNEEDFDAQSLARTLLSRAVADHMSGRTG